MKTTKTLQQVSAEWRQKNGNVVKKKDITTGKIFQFSAAELRHEIIRQSEKSIAREIARKIMSVREFCRDLVQQKLKKIARELPSDGLSMGSRYYVKVKTSHADVIGISDRTSEYSNSSGYSATHYSHYVYFSPLEISKIKIIGGLATIIHEEIEHGIYRAEWIGSQGQKQHYSIVRKFGFLTKQFHGTIEAARQFRKDETIRLFQERKRKIEKAQFAQKIEKAKNLFYGLHHAIAAGNCLPGIENFISNTQLEKDYGFRGDFLLSLGKKLGVEYNVNRMIEQRAMQL